MKILTPLFVMALVGPASAADNATVAVMPLRSINVPQYVTDVLDSTLAVAVGDAGDGLRVLSANDINAMLGVERMKDAVGCDDVSCAVDIGGALNAELIVTGSIGKLGNKLTINLVLVNIAETAVEARVQETIRDDENMYQDGVRGATQRLFENGLSRPREPEPGAISSIATVKQEVAATREATRQQMQTLAKLVETVEMQELSTNQRLALVDEFAATLEEDAPAREATTALRTALESGGPLTTRNVMLGAYGFGGVGNVNGSGFGAFGVILEAGRFRWRYFQVCTVRASLGTTTRPTYDQEWMDTGHISTKAPLLAGIGLGGIGAKLPLDAIGRHEVGFLAFPLSISHLSASSMLNEETPESLYGLLRSAVYYRFASPSWAFEVGLELTPVWKEAGRSSFFGLAGDRTNGDLQPIVAYAGATWPL